MKKILFACIAIISMLLLTAQPLFVYAEDGTLPETQHLEDLEQNDGDIPSRPAGKLHGYEYYRNRETSDTYFIYVCVKQKYSSIYYFHDLYLSFEQGEATFDNGVLSISNADRIGSNNQHIKGYYNRQWWATNTNTYNDDYDGYSAFTSAEFDFTNMSFIVKDGNSVRCNLNTTDNNYVTGTYNIYTNIPEILNAGGSIDVVFTPSLAGIVTRQSINDNGVSGLSNYFSMDITNNTAYGCQYRMMIKDTNGQAVTPYNQGDSDTNYQPNWENGFSVNDDGSFVFINDEWIYVSPTIGGGVCKALKPSEWHYIDSGNSIHQDFAWSQFDFKKDHTYICMVYAITNELGCATALDSSRTGLYNNYPDYCLDFTTQALVYQTVFSISNPATFNPNDNSFGNKIRNANWSGDKGDFTAYEDPSNGNTISGNGNVDELRDLPNSVVSGGSHGGGGYSTYHDTTLNNIYGSGSYTSNRSFAQLNSYFGGYFGFLSAIIGFYPSPYQTLIMIGFAGLVVIGILKAALK